MASPSKIGPGRCTVCGQVIGTNGHGSHCCNAPWSPFRDRRRHEARLRAMQLEIGKLLPQQLEIIADLMGDK